MIYPNEKQTRKRLIDQALCAAGRTLIIPLQNPLNAYCAAVEEYPTRHGPADYVLYSNSRPIAIVSRRPISNYAIFPKVN